MDGDNIALGFYNVRFKAKEGVFNCFDNNDVSTEGAKKIIMIECFDKYGNAKRFLLKGMILLR